MSLSLILDLGLPPTACRFAVLFSLLAYVFPSADALNGWEDVLCI